jgi:hypothetical protein
MAKEMAIREQTLDFREYKENPAEELKWGRAKAVLNDAGLLSLKQKGKFDLSVQSTTLIQIPGKTFFIQFCLLYKARKLRGLFLQQRGRRKIVFVFKWERKQLNLVLRILRNGLTN